MNGENRLKKGNVYKIRKAGTCNFKDLDPPAIEAECLESKHEGLLADFCYESRTWLLKSPSGTCIRKTQRMKLISSSTWSRTLTGIQGLASRRNSF